MKMNRMFGQTLRQAPSDAEVVSHQLLLRAGFIRQLAAGIFTLMPLAKRSSDKIKNIIRDEMDRIGGQEVEMPVIHPAEIWKKTQRWYQIGSEMGRFYDKNNRDMVLAFTHEEVVADLLRTEVSSHKQLPAMVYHIQTKWRDDPRPRAGLIRTREFTMLDSYTLDATQESQDEQYDAHYDAYFRIFNRCGLPSIAVEADTGVMGGSMSHEYMYLTPIGEDTLLICDSCGFKANQQVSTFKKPSAAAEEMLELEKVETPNAKTIAGLAEFLNIPTSKTAKAVFLMATLPDEDGVGEHEEFVFAIVRGDMEVSDTKLSNALKAKSLRPATEAEIVAIGGAPGYASPVGLDASKFNLVVDDAVVDSPNLVAGANEAGYHLLNTNADRDYKPSMVVDIAAAQGGDACSVCGDTLQAKRGVEVGNIFKLGTKYSIALGGMFNVESGKRQPVILGSYGIGVGRLLACVAEEYNDEYGLIWPISIAPYHVHLVALKGGEDVAEQLYNDLWNVGIEVLLDDRKQRPGVKFKDADLIGIPLRITVGARSLDNGGVEFKKRTDKDREIVAVDDIIGRIQTEKAALEATLQG